MKKSPPLAKNGRKSKRSTLKPKTKKPKAVPKGMVKVVKGTLKKMKPLKASKYDGVLGMPPSWVPEPEKRQFFATRSALLEEYSAKEVLQFIVSRKRRWQGGFSFGPDNIPPAVEDGVDTLNDIKKLISLGEKKALKIILGSARDQDRSSGKKFRVLAKKGHKAKTKINQARWAEYQQIIDELYSKRPSHSYNRLCQLAAEKCGVSLKTIQRRTTNPKKKS